ncbi:YdcF family protein [Microbacterium sp. NPDC019599]|uniref:YdcF family protein n=1 Tax=Microbacterium sp. NPDC019599 TaxID=3154690 RepID=UPI0033D1D849
MRALSVRAAVAITLTLQASIGVAACAGFGPYVSPPAEAIGDADLIYVIGPPVRERVAVERELRAERVADRSLYSVGLTGGYSAEELAVCAEPQVDCAHPTPFTTKGELAYLKQYAAEHDVERTVVLTFTPHVARTRYILDKCYPGDAVVVAVDQNLVLADWIAQYGYQSLAFVKAWLTPCADASRL